MTLENSSMSGIQFSNFKVNDTESYEASADTNLSPNHEDRQALLALYQPQYESESEKAQEQTFGHESSSENLDDIEAAVEAPATNADVELNDSVVSYQSASQLHNKANLELIWQKVNAINGIRKMNMQFKDERRATGAALDKNHHIRSEYWQVCETFL